MTMNVPLTAMTLDEREAQAAAQTILSGWVTQGPQVKAFEDECAAYVGAEHACAVSNCTAALHLALRAAGTKPGDEIITASHTFIATASAIRYCGAEPVFVDLAPNSFNIDPQNIEARITTRTRAILCVHQMGMPCDLRRIVPLARKHGLYVIEDAACAIGSEVLVEEGGWQKIGRPHGDVACFSFHPRKVITTGEGGMLMTDDPAWDEQFRRWRHHGMSLSDRDRHRSRTVSFECYPELGYNYRMSDIQAAVGREQLKRLPEIVERRRTLARRYAERLDDLPECTPPAEPEWARSNWQSYCVRLPEALDPRPVMQYLLDRGIATRRGIMCCHLESSSGQGTARADLQHSESARDHGIILPLFPHMTAAQQDEVVRQLREALHAYACSGHC